MELEGDLRHVSFEGGPALRTVQRRLTSARAPLQSAVGASTAAPSPGATDPAAAFARSVLALGGLEGAAYRADVLRRRVPACLRALKARSEEQALQRLRERADLLPAAVSALLIGVTEFFRDPDVFDALQAHVLPLMASRRRLRVWSAAAACGAEACSVAMLLAEHRLLDRAEILGTDCRRDAIEQAREAWYRTPAAPPGYRHMLKRYGEADADGMWCPVARLRRRMHWKVSDLLRTVEAGPWDVILWRNAGMYLDTGPAADVAHRLIAQLAPGGFLVLGRAERPPDPRALQSVHRCIYRARNRS